MQQAIWHTHSLLPMAKRIYQKLVTQKRHGAINSDWWAVGFSFDHLQTRINAFVDGSYRFSPLQQFRFKEETIRMWGYDDRIMLRLFLRILKPTFKHIISTHCFHLAGPNGVKEALRYVENALDTGKFHYAIRIDIKSYYASINHRILKNRVNEHFDDPKVQCYLADIISTAVIDGGDVFLPTQGIPRRSSLSPFFGALYLSPIDLAFQHRKNIVYARFMDDILILFQTKRQYRKARRTLFNLLASLKLSLSSRKSWMGELTQGFHFLGVRFGVAKPEEKNQRSITIHPRSCTRALDNVKALSNNAVHPATIQGYLAAWARWWANTVGPLNWQTLLIAWIDHARVREPTWAWLGSGLLLGSLAQPQGRLI
jgi:RNA-directed DNA polymerase